MWAPNMCYVSRRDAASLHDLPIHPALPHAHAFPTLMSFARWIRAKRSSGAQSRSACFTQSRPRVFLPAGVERESCCGGWRGSVRGSPQDAGGRFAAPGGYAPGLGVRGDAASLPLTQQIPGALIGAALHGRLAFLTRSGDESSVLSGPSGLGGDEGRPHPCGLG